MIYKTKLKKTQYKIVQAMFTLLEEESFNKITVNNIIEKVDINRSTFYRNFVDKYEVIEIMEDTFIKSSPFSNKEFVKSIINSVVLSKEPLDAYKAIYFMEENYDYVKIFLSENFPSSFKDKLITFLKSVVRENITNINKNISNLELDFIANYLANNVLNTLTYYVEHPKTDMNKYFELVLKLNKNGIYSMIVE